MYRRLLGCSMLFLVAAAACGNDPRPEPAVDCTVPVDVEFGAIFRDFEVDGVTWFASGDSTGAPEPFAPALCDGGTEAGAGGVPEGGTDAATLPVFDPATTTATEAFARVPIEGQRCGSSYALLLTSSGHNDWGTLFGDYGMINAPPDGRGWDGIALWARTGTRSDRAVTLAIDTPQTSPERGGCKEYCNDQQNQTFTDPNTGLVVTEGDVDPPDACGNQFQRKLVTTERWQLYLLPFDTFQQEPQPSAKPSMDKSEILRLSVRADKGTTLELWLDDIRLYRRK